MPKQFALAISVYDRFTDVKILVDLVRENWPVDTHIAVCSSHPSAPVELAGLAIDELFATEDIPVDPATYTWAEMHMHLTMRVLDSIRKTCRSGAASSAPYTMHVHADALPLSWERVSALTARMKDTGKTFAARGDGWGFYSPREPVGSIDDMFFVFENDVARSSGLWEFDLLDFLPHKLSIHGTLATLVLTRVGIKRFMSYASHLGAVHWDGRQASLPPLNAAHPMYFDPANAFLHIHENAFPNNLGQRLKAHYLKSFGITKGPAIEAFLRAWDTPSDALFSDLARYEAGLTAFFGRRGLRRFATFGYDRDFRALERIRSEYRALPPIRRLLRLARLHISQLKSEAKRRWRAHERARFRTEMYRDIVWPGRLDDVYRERLSAGGTALAGRFELPT